MDLFGLRAQRHAALGDPIRLAIVDELAASDRAPIELQRLAGVTSNLLAHHLDVLEQVGLVTRSRSSGDGRRRYVHLHRDALDGLTVASRRRAGEHCSSAPTTRPAHNWPPRCGPSSPTNRPTPAAPTPRSGFIPVRPPQPAAPASISTNAYPKRLEDVDGDPELVVTVCDRAHEELGPDPTRLHWSVPDPVARPSRAAFDATVGELRSRIRHRWWPP